MPASEVLLAASSRILQRDARVRAFRHDGCCLANGSPIQPSLAGSQADATVAAGDVCSLHMPMLAASVHIGSVECGRRANNVYDIMYYRDWMPLAGDSAKHIPVLP
jgi:hypothetical protein